MSTNPYFESSFTAGQYDQELYNQLVMESIQVHGRDYYYLPRTLTDYNQLFGEDVVSTFKSAAKVEMYLENITGWEGEQQFISKFGIEIRDEASLIVNRTRFEEEIGSKFGFKYPREGDLVIFPYEVDERIRVFEISFVDPDAVFFQLGKNYVYRLKVRVFEYNGEDFDTGIDQIDKYEINNKITQTIELSHGNGQFYPGETVTQGNYFVATVIMHNISENKLIITMNESPNSEDSKPLFSMNLPITNNSGTEWFVKDLENSVTSPGNADNQLIEDKSDFLIDVSENNPFIG